MHLPTQVLFSFFQVLVTTLHTYTYLTGKNTEHRGNLASALTFGGSPICTAFFPSCPVCSSLQPTNSIFKIQDSRFLPVSPRHRARACFALPGPHRDTESRRRKPGERIWTWKWSRTLRNPHRSRRQPRPLLLGVRGPSNTESPGGVTGLRCRASSAGRAKSDAIATSRAPAA